MVRMEKEENEVRGEDRKEAKKELRVKKVRWFLSTVTLVCCKQDVKHDQWQESAKR